jgi:hypothetical protein
MTIKRNGHQTARYRALKRWGQMPRVYTRRPTPSLLRQITSPDGPEAA